MARVAGAGTLAKIWGARGAENTASRPGGREAWKYRRRGSKRAFARMLLYSPISPMDSSRPTTGSLDAKPLYQLLLRALETKLSGSLVFETPDRAKSALTLIDGNVVKAKTAVPIARIGTVLVGNGTVSGVQLEQVLARPREELLGEVLVRDRVVTREQLERALRDQLIQQIEWIARLPSGALYGYYPTRDYLARWGGGPREVDPLLVIWRSLCAANPSDGAMERALDGLQDRPLRLHTRSRVGRFEFGAKERALIDVLRAKPSTLVELLALELLPPREARRVIYVLALTRHLDLGLSSGPLGVEVTLQPQSATASSISTQRQKIPLSSQSLSELKQVVTEPPPTAGARQRVAEVEAEYLLAADYYRVLGVSRDASPATINAAFLGLAKRWHPDKFDPSSGLTAGTVTKVFARVSEAHQVLSSSERRREYDRQVSEDSLEDQEHVQQVLRAASAFQKAEVLVKRSEWEQALEQAKQAHAEDPGQAEYEALFLWLSSRQLDLANAEAITPVLSRLSAAVKKQPNNNRVRLYRARVLEAVGKINEAMREYRTVAEADPTNVEAQRMLRLHRMRTSGAELESSGGLLGRLFKKH